MFLLIFSGISFGTVLKSELLVIAQADLLLLLLLPLLPSAHPAQLQQAHAATAIVEMASVQMELAAPSMVGAEPLPNTVAVAAAARLAPALPVPLLPVLLLPAQHQQDLGTGRFVPTVISAQTSAAVASTQAACSSAPLWVDSRLRKAVSDLPPPALPVPLLPVPLLPVPALPAPHQQDLGTGRSVPTVINVSTNAAATSIRPAMAVSSVPL